MTDPILEEVYAARQRLWNLGGGTIAGVCAYLRAHPIPGVRYADLPTAKPRRPRARPLRAASSKNAARP